MTSSSFSTIIVALDTEVRNGCKTITLKKTKKTEMMLKVRHLTTLTANMMVLVLSRKLPDRTLPFITNRRFSSQRESQIIEKFWKNFISELKVDSEQSTTNVGKYHENVFNRAKE